MSEPAGAFRSLAGAGPAFAAIEALGPIDWTEWARAATALTARLPAGPDIERRVHHLYLPVLFFCLAWLKRLPSRPLMVGVQAPQGSGKTTLVRHLLELLPVFGLKGTGVSIDDFYLTRAEQLAVAAHHAGNPYLEHRGYPGTHDVALGARTLTALRALGEGERRVRVPVYDKTAHGGRGDRAPESAWRDERAPLDLVFVEGWLLGYTPLPEAALGDPRLAFPNQALVAYAEWHRLLDVLVILRAVTLPSIVQWRVDAEAAAAAAGRPGLGPAAIEDYIRRFLPAYAAYGGAPPDFPRDRQLTIWLDEQRRAVRPPAS
jgi:D-glycerate 3-kinase